MQAVTLEAGNPAANCADGPPAPVATLIGTHRSDPEFMDSANRVDGPPSPVVTLIGVRAHAARVACAPAAWRRVGLLSIDSWSAQRRKWEGERTSDWLRDLAAGRVDVRTSSMVQDWVMQHELVLTDRHKRRVAAVQVSLGLRRILSVSVVTLLIWERLVAVSGAMPRSLHRHLCTGVFVHCHCTTVVPRFLLNAVVQAPVQNADIRRIAGQENPVTSSLTLPAAWRITGGNDVRATGARGLAAEAGR